MVDERPSKLPGDEVREIILSRTGRDVFKLDQSGKWHLIALVMRDLDSLVAPTAIVGQPAAPQTEQYGSTGAKVIMLHAAGSLLRSRRGWQDCECGAAAIGCTSHSDWCPRNG